MLNNVNNLGKPGKELLLQSADLRTDEMWTARDAAIELSRHSRWAMGPDDWLAILERLAPAGTFHSADVQMRADEVNALLEADPSLRSSTARLPSARQSALQAAIWWDDTMHAADWFSMLAVSPRNGARLLCQNDPIDKGADPERQSNPETGPADFALTLQVFEDVHLKNPKQRTLVEWIEIAKSRNCKCHSWLGEYLEARARLGFPVAPAPPTADTSSAQTATKTQAVAIDFNLYVTRAQLIKAFGTFTGMDDSWFTKLADTPKLKAARKVAGQGGRGHIAEPLFCPYEVMLWLVDTKRRKGNPIQPTTAWRMLKLHFNAVYVLHSIGDPNNDD